MRRHKKRRAKFISHFAEDCRRFFRNAQFQDGDHVFFTTVSELELLALSQFLSNNPGSLRAHWHLQFHFNLFEGRTPEYDKQTAIAKSISSCFDIAAAQMPYHRCHFYTTSELLAEQYQRLKVGQFEVLPYPVSDSFRPDLQQDLAAKADSDQALRFTCPGAIRREKGHVEYLQPLVNKIWDDYLSQGKMRLVIQRPPRKLVRGEKLELDFPATESGDAQDVVDYLPHPLPSGQYSDLIRSTDCGLLFYDSRTYFSRRAGVMGELLSCGKPVIVSAGSWLAEQIKETNFEYVESLTRTGLAKRSFGLEDLAWSSDNVPLPGGVISFNDERHPFEFTFERESDEGGFCVFWDWHWPQDNGVFNRVELIGGDGETAEMVQTVGHRRGKPACSFLRFGSDATSVKLRFRNAFHHSMASIKNVRVVTLDKQAAEIAWGTVGIVAADEAHLPNCIDEMVQHYEHYRRSAGKFAHGWYSRHEPKRTIAHLVSVEQQYAKRRAA
jgi:hypothetical protein